MIKVVLKGIAVDNITGMPIVLLSDEENEKDVYPIWIGVPEAEGIVLTQSGFKSPRPLTYDLFKTVIESLGGEVVAVEVVDKVDNAYVANVVLKKDNTEIRIDARPSDAINLALRFEAPIYLNSEIFDKFDIDILENQKSQQEHSETDKQTENPTSQTNITDDDFEKFRQMLENIKPEDFALNNGETV